MATAQANPMKDTPQRPQCAGDHRFDVAILGAGVGGSTLAAILAHHGVRVLLVEADSHPRFTIGESTIPETAGLVRLIGERYSIPEAAHLATFQSVRHHVSSACGVKRGFTFIYHREGQPQRPEESTQFPTLAPPWGPDVHWFRQDIDSYMFAAAVRYGATARQRLRIKDMQRDDKWWHLASDKGEQFEARYLVDAGGIRSPMAEAYGLRDDPPRQRTNSRSMFTHMVGVRPYDQCVDDARAFGLCSPCYQGTLHHVFDGGWLWVIPFDNHPDSTNPLCSVGLQLDRRKYPDSDVSPEEEFQALLNRFPSMARQFECARPVRDWVRSNARLQFSSRLVQGDGYILLPHAAGFIDPLFSSGLAITFNFIYNFAGHLIQAAREDDFSQHRFVHAESWMQNNIDHFDKLVSGAYDSWADFRLWNAWFRLWAIGTFFGSLGPIYVQIKYLQTGDARYLALMEETPYRGVAGSDFSLFLPLLDAANEQMEEFRSGRTSAPEAADQIFALLAKADFLPPLQRFASPAARGTGPFTVPALVRTYFWGRLRAPKPVRDLYFDGPLLTLVRLTIRLFWLELRRSLRTILATTRDHVATWNNEWKHPRYDSVMPAKPISHSTANRPIAGPVPTVAKRESIAISR